MRECCTDHNGQPKRKYKTKAEAEKIAQIRREDGVTVSVYPCDEGNGWHLTSRNTQPMQTYEDIMVQKELMRHKQKARNPLGSLVDQELASQLKQMALVTLETKIEEIQDKIEQQKSLYHNHKKHYIEIRTILRELEASIRSLEQERIKCQHEYDLAKRRQGPRK